MLYNVLFLLILAKISAQKNQYCDLPCDDGSIHTICRRGFCDPVPGCKEIPMTPEIRQHIVDLHNQYRNRIATGREIEIRGQVSNMRMMTYDMELEKIAQCHANECITSGPQVNDQCRKTKEFRHVGQNIYINFGRIFKDEWLTANYTTRLLTWYNEITHVDPSNYQNFTQLPKKGHYQRNFKGEFTQLIWADSHKIGCARATKFSQYSQDEYSLIFVCNYGPGGNILGKPVFYAGQACSNCPKNTTCSYNYTGLCGGSSTNIAYKMVFFLISIVYLL